MMRKVMLLLGVAGVLFIGFTAIVTARYRSDQSPVAPVLDVGIPEGAAARLAEAIRIPTVAARETASFDGTPFRAFHAYLEAAFPRVRSQLLREVVAEHSLLYTWQGWDPSLKPILLIGHLDVVPIETQTEKAWQQPPFSGRIADGFIWGRGAIDNKSAVVGTLEAVEMLLGEGFQPARTIYLAYGHDEETGGAGGAAKIAALLKSRGVDLEMVLDEGGVIGSGILPGISRPIALVGVAEKGFVTIELATRAPGGHSSLPPRQSAIGILSAAVARLEHNQMRSRLDGATRLMFDRIAPELPFVQRALFANLWLTRPLVTRTLEQDAATNAMVRTTTAVTIFQAGTKDNVLPRQAEAIINFRILPGDSIATVVEHVKRVIHDERVEVRTAGRFSAEPSLVSGVESESFKSLERAIRGVAPDAIVAPYLVVVVTDARYYSGLTRNVFRFLPLRLTSRDLERMHGIDERIGVREYEEAIRIYRQLILECAGNVLNEDGPV